MDVSGQLFSASKSPSAGRAVPAGQTYSLRKAGLLDLPFIFGQIMEGSVEGAYSERFLSGGGNVHLFRLLLASLSPFGRLLGKRKLYDFLMFRDGGNDIGFAGMYTSLDVEPKGALIIGFFGIAREYRGKKHGALMLRQLVEHLPAEARVAAYTTKYSTGMQHLLRKQGFRQAANFAGCQQKVYLLDKSKAR